MKKLKYLLGLSLLIFVGYFYGMKRSADTSSRESSVPVVEAYFSPTEDEKDSISKQLLSFLNQAKSQILIAVYWLVDSDVIDKLQKKKRKKVDVQVIIDESTFTTFTKISPKNIIDPLVNDDINLLVYPSQQLKTNAIGIMHNKFVVIDGQYVFTGSANFTKRGLEGQDMNSNYENVVIINNENIAKEFEKTFNEIRKDILHFYIKLIANADELDQWVHVLLPKLPKHELEEERQRVWTDLNQTQQNKLQKFFADFGDESSEESLFPFTEPQVNLLRGKGYSDEEIRDMLPQVEGKSKNYIYNFVGSRPHKQLQYGY